MTPRRIQRKRTKGWKMPPNSVYIGRPSIFGNPYPTAAWGAKEARTLYTLGLNGKWTELEKRAGHNCLTTLRAVVYFQKIRRNLHKLRGKNLACWCPLTRNGKPVPCHGDVLLRAANKEKP